MTEPRRPEDDDDFLKDLGEIRNDTFTPERRQPARNQKPEPVGGDDPDADPDAPMRVPVQSDDDEFDALFADTDLEDDGFFLPIFSLGELDKGELTDGELDVIDRISPFVTCPVCNTDGAICDCMFSHLAETAMWRLAALCSEITEITTGLRQKIALMGCDTYDSIDLTILSLAGEIARLRSLIPKLHAAQDGFDSF